MPLPLEFASATLDPQALPQLVPIDVAANVDNISPPVKRIQSDADLQHWRTTKAYHNVALTVARLGEAAVGKATRWPIPSPSSSISRFESVDAVARLLLQLRTWVRDIKPREGAQRFGNLAFRDWGARLEEKNDALHHELFEKHPSLKPYIVELKAYLADSFGSFVRIDYGSGHEVNFVAWLAYLIRLGFFGEDFIAEDDTTLSLPHEVESDIALLLIPMYLDVVWSLQDTYGLEPAGSHGVWGLDDYQFLPYILGAAQLRQQTMYKPSQISLPSHKPSSARTASSGPSSRITPGELLSFIPRDDSSSSPSPPFANLFTSSIARIHALKTGPFFEHSPLLYDISTSVPNWKKVSSGMMKMWDNEVVGKRPVVQHFVFGGVGFRWDEREDSGQSQAQASVSQPATQAQTQTQARPAPSTAMAPTGAPWAAKGPHQTSTTMAPTPAPWSRPVPGPSGPERQGHSQQGVTTEMLPPLLGARRGKTSAQPQQKDASQPPPQ